MQNKFIAFAFVYFLVAGGVVFAGEDVKIDHDKIVELQHEIAINDWRIAQLEAARSAGHYVEQDEPFFSEYVDKWGVPLIRVGPTQFFFRKPRRRGYTPTLREADDAKNNTRTAKPGPFSPKIRTNNSSDLPHGIYRVE